MKGLVITTLTLVSWAIVAGVVFLVVGVFTAQEGDALGNCYLYGNGNCGASAPWHGFVGASDN